METETESPAAEERQAAKDELLRLLAMKATWPSEAGRKEFATELHLLRAIEKFERKAFRPALKLSTSKQIPHPAFLSAERAVEWYLEIYFPLEQAAIINISPAERPCGSWEATVSFKDQSVAPILISGLIEEDGFHRTLHHEGAPEPVDKPPSGCPDCARRAQIVAEVREQLDAAESVADLKKAVDRLLW